MLRYRILGALALAGAAVAYVATNSALALALLLTILGVALAGAVTVTATARSQVAVTLPAACEVGQPLCITVSVERPSGLLVSPIELVLALRNVMTGEASTLVLTLEYDGHRSSTYTYELATTACGLHECQVAEARCAGPFGVSRRSLACGFEGAFMVYPRLLDVTVSVGQSRRLDAMGRSYDQRRRGQDPSEVFDIREYQAEDPLKMVHWKLSSKMDRLVVREASRPVSYDMLVLPDRRLCDATGAGFDAALVNDLMEALAALSHDLRRQGVGHIVAFPRCNALVEKVVDSEESFEEMVDELLGTPLVGPGTFDNLALSDLLAERDFSKIVMVVLPGGERLLDGVAHEADVSVLCIANDTSAFGDVREGYSVQMIEPRSLGNAVKGLVV